LRFKFGFGFRASDFVWVVFVPMALGYPFGFGGIARLQ
jgi:hypothetical protein